MPPLCTICFDDDAPIEFECATPECEYMLCGDCLEDAFKDFSGGNSKDCQLCKRPSAIRMAEARIGKGGVKAVQRELRETVETEVRREQGLYETGKKEATETNEEALHLFNSVSEMLNLTCPKCNMVFNDYTGCNALTCANTSCGAKFCAICLKDCGRDAHAHVRQEHGNLFDRAMFEASNKRRSCQIIEGFLSRLENEGKPFDLRQLVRNHLERAGHLTSAGSTGSSFKSERFIQEATDDLKRVIASDRQSILMDSQDGYMGRQRISKDSVSPRAALPDTVRVWLDQAQDQFELVVEVEIEGRFVTAESLDQLKEWIKNGVIPAAGPLATLKQAMGCAVIALDGFQNLYQVRRGQNQKGSDKMTLYFSSVDRHGEVEEGHDSFDYHRNRRIRVLAVNPNHRYLSLLKHIIENVSPDSLPMSIKNFIGQGEPQPVFFELQLTLPETLAQLNEYQRKAGNPLCLKSAGEVAGPPGTGKTRTISELVRALLRCTTKDIVVLSERNGAIDAIAEKFASLCIRRVGPNKKVTDMAMWRNIMTFGSADAIGEHTRVFLLDEKVKYHPEILQAIKEENDLKAAYAKHGRKMLDAIAQEVRHYAEKFDDDLAWNQHDKIRRSTHKDISSPPLIVVSVRKARQGASSLLRASITEDQLDAFLQDHHGLMHGLFSQEFVKKDVLRRLRDLESRLSKILQLPLFDSKNTKEIESRHMAAQQARQAVEERVKQELMVAPRLKMSTIGSSHKLFDKLEEEEDGPDGAIIRQLRALAIEEEDERDGAVVIFDESGCIPSFELLGLSRLGCPIAAILTVGDTKQLPPYNPTNQSKRKPSGRFRRQESYAESNGGLKSLLDVSEVKDKISLLTQYRVPRDIANILNIRVYNGNYKTHARCGVPDQGLEFCHVDKLYREERRKYQNTAEVMKVLELARNKMNSGEYQSIMILTPYKNQQRELQFQVKRMKENPIEGLTESCILTIDQCQGQEADLVLFTLVQKPTRFLNKNRLNVAMSRTRKKLIIVGDRHQFVEASKNNEWDCAFIAQDILARTF